jgi:hypothetical protein
MMKTIAKLTGLATLFALTLSACGGGGGSTDNAVTPNPPVPSPAPSPAPAPGPAPTPNPPINADTRELNKYLGTWRRCQTERDTVEGGGTGTRVIGSRSSTLSFGSTRGDGTINYTETDEYYTTPDCTTSPVGTIETLNGSIAYSGTKFLNNGNLVDKLTINEFNGFRRFSGSAARLNSITGRVVISLDIYTYSYDYAARAAILKDIALTDGINLTTDFGGAEDSQGFPIQLNAFVTWRKS